MQKMRKRSRKIDRNALIEDILTRLEKELDRYVYYRHITKDIKTKELIEIHSFVWSIKGHITGFSIPDTDFETNELEQRLHDSIAQAKFEIALNS